MGKALHIIDKYIFAQRTYKLFAVIVLFFLQVPILHVVLGSYVKCLLAFGILLCIFDIFYRKNFLVKMKDSVNILLFLFAISYIFTICINHSLKLSENIKQEAYMLVFFWILFMITIRDDSEDIHSEMRLISWAILIVTFVLSFASFMTFVLNINEWYWPLENSARSYIGVDNGNLYGLYNSNVCGEIALTSILSSSLLVFTNDKQNRVRNKWPGIIFIATNFLLQFIVLVLSKSRGSFYSYLLVVFIISFILVLKKLSIKVPARVMVSFIISVLLIASIAFLSVLIDENSSYFIVVSDEDAVIAEKDTFYENIIEDALKKYYDTTSAHLGLIKLNIGGRVTFDKIDIDSITTGRLELWRAGLKTFIQHPIFGVTREGLVEKVNNNLGYNSVSLVGGGLHNIYLTILVSSGALGFILIISAFLISLYKFLVVLFLKKEVNLDILLSFSVVLMFLISELVENRILYQVTVFNVVFWIYFGYFYYFVRKEFNELKNISCSKE